MPGPVRGSPSSPAQGAQASGPVPARDGSAQPAERCEPGNASAWDLETLYRSAVTSFVRLGSGSGVHPFKSVENYDQFLAFVRIRIRDAADACDLVHDAFLSIRRAYPEKQGEELRRLIYTALRNRTNDHLKSHDTKRRNTSVEISDYGHLLPCSSSVTPEKRLIDTQTLQLVSQAMEEMSPRQREVLHLRRYEGLTVEAVAARLSISPTTAKTDLMAAMKAIARSIERAEGRRR